MSVKKDGKEISVTGIVTDNQEQAKDTARSLANMFLNNLSWRHGRHLEITYVVKTEHTLANGEKRVKYIEPPIEYAASIEMQIYRVGTSGDLVEAVYDSTRLSKIDVWPSEAAPYYRRAQLATDPFDRFRNFYFVAENISSQIALIKKLGKLKDQQLLEAGLEECFRGQEDALNKATKAVPVLGRSNPLIPVPVSEVARILYKAERCELNHSKAKESKKIPFNPQDEKEVQSTLPLMEFVAKSFLDYQVRFPSGGSITSP